MLKSITALIIFILPALAHAQIAFDPSQVKVSDLKYNGTGCPAGTVAWDLSTDKQAMTILFDRFIAETTGISTRALDVKRRSCQLTLKLETPAGWTFSLFSLDFRGFAGLDAGATGTQNTTYKLGNSRKVYLGKLELAGPYSDDYARIDDVTLGKLPWSQCSKRKQALVINTSIAVQSVPGAAGLMTVDSVDGSITQSYGIVWKRCDSGKRNVNTQFAAQCRTEIVKKADGAIVRDLIALGRGPDEENAIELASRKVKNKCARILKQNDGKNRNMCSTAAPVCTVSHL
jgi:hypothetical protein